jgi:hypothetical protein
VAAGKRSEGLPDALAGGALNETDVDRKEKAAALRRFLLLSGLPEL